LSVCYTPRMPITPENKAALDVAAAAMQAIIAKLESDPAATAKTKAAGHALSGKVKDFSTMWGT